MQMKIKKNAGNAHINTIIADIQLQNAQSLFCFDEWWHSCECIEKNNGCTNRIV